MRKTILFSLFFVGITFAQTPLSYKINEASRLAKINDTTPKSNTINDVLIADGTIWLGTSRGLSRSIDDGKTWKNYYGDQTFGKESISAIGYNNGVIYVATAHAEMKDGQSFPFGTGLKYSLNNGDSWESTPQSVDNTADSLIVYGVNNLRILPVTTQYNNISYDIAFTEGTIWTTNFAGGLRKSVDNGKTWERVVLPPDYLNSINPDSSYNFSVQPVAGNFGNESYLNHRVFSAVGLGNKSIAVGTANGINISEDNGKTWRKLNHQNQSDGITGNFIVGLGYNNVNNTLFAATWKAEDLNEEYGVSSSNDLGQNWTKSLLGKRVHNFGFLVGDAFATADENVFRTNNLGNSWTNPTSIFDNQKKINIDFSKTDFNAVGVSSNNGVNEIYIGSTDGLLKLYESNPPWGGDWEIFIASTSNSNSVGETYAFPNPFSPNLESVKIKYTISKNSSVTIRIMDFSMNLVRTIIQNANRISDVDNFEIWDGKDQFGTEVANGVYFYRIDTDSTDPFFGKIMVVK